MVPNPAKSAGRRGVAVRPAPAAMGNQREAQLAQRCQRFVDVAQALFLERGFAGTSVNEVVRRAGGSLATLYAAFGTKDELFEAVMNRRADAMFTNIIHRKSRAAHVGGELRELARRLQAHMLSEHALALYRLAVHEGPKFPTVRHAVLVTGLEGFLAQLAAYFARLSKSGKLTIDDPFAAGELFLTLVQGQLRTIAACGDAAKITRKQRDDHVKRAVAAFLCIYPPKRPAKS